MIFNVMQGCHLYISHIHNTRVWKEAFSNCLVVFKEMIGRVFLIF